MHHNNRPPRILWLRPLRQRELAFRSFLRSGIELVTAGEVDEPYTALGDRVLPLADVQDYPSVEDAIIKFNESFPLDGIITFIDYLLPTVANLNKKLGLRGLQPDSAEMCYRKQLQRAAFKKAAVPSAHYIYFNQASELSEAIKIIKYPAVLKPVDRNASRGVILIENAKQLDAAFEFSASETWGGGYILEEYLEGKEYGVDVVTRNGKSKAIAISDKTFLDGRHFVRNCHWLPSNLSVGEEKSLLSIAERAATSVSVTDAVTHVQLRFTSDGPKVIEINGRVTGGFNADLLLAATGLNLYDISIDLMLDREPKLEKSENRYTALREIVTGTGIVDRWDIGNIPFSCDKMIVFQSYISEGQNLSPAEDGHVARAVIAATGEQRADADAEVERLAKNFTIYTRPEN